ncbi:glycosyl transferase family protein [Sodiomyces alkalinus F11]|uniref:Glycosyl transferase family protein n=1 Tax=Sodiomyces alkalinus (strain CBS 110278 / VKM F-3762 / F11) TaxID=1314773 RepID=A0A3N2Q445_SODAK|nr:glycosyl transferase family protein [Sodiomyces alkalinus F11]ROT41477.1 glycosyl transferase family protein [Sodiomyces alkalinus F11]
MADGKRVVDSDKVYTVLITNEAYLPGLFTLDYSLRKHGSRYPLVALYTDTVPASAHEAIDRRGIPKQRIEYLLPTKGRDYSNDPRFYDCWSKLTPFSLTQYTRVVQLDADMLVRHNIDDLMTLPLDDPAVSSDPANQSTSSRVFAAGHACVCNPLRKPHYPPDWLPSNCAFTTQHQTPDLAQHTGPDPTTDSPLGYMNGGLQVVNPSKALYAQILDHMERGAANMDFADQSLLSDLFRARWVALPYVYNALKTLRWPGVHDAIWRDDRVRVVHYILAPKPWDERGPDGRWNGPANPDDDVTHRWWAEYDAERRAAERDRGIDDGL